MKTLFAAAALTISLLPLAAQAETLTKEVSRVTYDISVAVNRSSVRCSSLGYGSPELKVDVVDLDWAAVFNHRQLGEGKPCMTAGVCDSRLNPARVLADGEGDVPTQLQVVHKEVAVIDRAIGSCQRELVEELSMELRGIKFFHRKSTALLETTATQCTRLYK